MNGRNDLDACWLIAHDARIPLSPAGNVKKRIACALDPKIIPDNIACRGKGEHWLCCVGCCYEVETPANACDTGRQTASYFVLGKSVKLQQCRLATAAICRIQVCGLRNRGCKGEKKTASTHRPSGVNCSKIAKIKSGEKLCLVCQHDEKSNLLFAIAYHQHGLFL